MEIAAREFCCRLCFISNGSFLNIFDDAFAADIADMLKKYFQDEVKLSDPLPNTICSDCWRKMESFHEFHKKVLSDREKNLNLYLEKMAIKMEQESALVTQVQRDGFSENICAESITVESIQIDDDNLNLLDDAHEPLILHCSLKEEDHLSIIDNDGSNSDYYEDYDENSNDEHFEADNYNDYDDELPVNKHPQQDIPSLPTNIKHLSTSQIHAVVTEHFDMSCDKCDTTFSGFDEAKSHYQFAHNISRGYVKCCDLKLKEHKNYRGHILWHLNPNVFDCLICGSSYKTLQSYHAHKHFHKNRALKRFNCDICKTDFAIKQKLIHHIMQVHATKKKYFCEECRHSFRTENQINVHNVYVHSGLDTQLTPERIEEITRTKFDMECELKPCKKVFESLQDAKEHYLNVHNISNGWIKCCNIKLKFNKETNDHIAWHINPTIFQCPDCGQLCSSRKKMNKHMLVHREKEKKYGHRTNIEQEDLFECEYCNKTFLKKIKLIEHMKFIHEPEFQKVKEAELLSRFFDMTCDKCDNVFESLGEALTHYIQEHNDQNGYIKCCDLQFSEMSLVKDHIKWHLDPNVFKCSQCYEKLPTRKALQSHILAHHSNGSFFICDICQKRFAVKDKLKRHILSTHLNYKMQCGLCEEKFKNFKHLQAHLESNHLDDLNNIEADIKDIPLLDLNDERMKAAMKTFVDQTCDICHANFDTLTDARKHYLNEHKNPKGYFKCCKSKLTFETTLIDHLNWHVNPEIFRCRLCCKVLGGRNSIMCHVRSHQAIYSKRFSCSKCSEVFPRIQMFRIHMETMHAVTVPKRRLLSNECLPNTFVDAIDKDDEEEEEDPNWDTEYSKLFDMTCNVNECTAVFTSLVNARRHYMKAHNNLNGFVKCCEIRLRTSFDVKDHIAWHKNPGCFKCAECGRDYKIKRGLVRHAESHSTNFQCNICDKKYSRKTTLINHMLWHENREKELKFFCADCNKSYYSEASLRSHRDRVHIITKGNNSFICEFCALSFRTEGLLRSHARAVHKIGPQKPKQKFKCDICLNFYASKGILRTHKLTHAEKLFNCKLCRKISPTAAALDLHMKAVHVEAKFKCHLCEKSFKLAPALKDHIATHLNDKQYKCTYCDDEFIWRTNMYKHRKRIHKMEWEADKAKRDAEKKML